MGLGCHFLPDENADAREPTTQMRSHSDYELVQGASWNAQGFEVEYGEVRVVGSVVDSDHHFGLGRKILVLGFAVGLRREFKRPKLSSVGNCQVRDWGGGRRAAHKTLEVMGASIMGPERGEAASVEDLRRFARR